MACTSLRSRSGSYKSPLRVFTSANTTRSRTLRFPSTRSFTIFAKREIFFSSAAGDRPGNEGVESETLKVLVESAGGTGRLPKAGVPEETTGVLGDFLSSARTEYVTKRT